MKYTQKILKNDDRIRKLNAFFKRMNFLIAINNFFYFMQKNIYLNFFKRSAWMKGSLYFYFKFPNLSHTHTQK